jgi:hypothetical protein
MRPEQTLHLDRELDPRTGIRRQQLLSHGYIENPAQDPKFLMNRSRLQPLALDKTTLDFDLDSILKAAPEIKLDVVGRNLREFASAEGFFQMQGSAQIGLVCFLGSQGWLGIVLQEKIHPG